MCSGWVRVRVRVRVKVITHVTCTVQVHHPSSVAGSRVGIRAGVAGDRTRAPVFRLPPGLSLIPTRPARASSDDLTSARDKQMGSTVSRPLGKGPGSGSLRRGPGRMSMSLQGHGQRMSQ